MQPAAAFLAPPIRVHGHRGARARRPENTLEAFRYGIAAGVDFVEMDVNITRDDVPLISHDPVLPTGETIRQFDFAYLRRIDPTVPSLDEVLALDGVGFNIEMKSFGDPQPERCAALLLASIERRASSGPVMVQSFDFRVLRAMRRAAPQIPLAALVETETPDFPAAVRQAGADMIAPEYTTVTAPQVSAAHAAGFPVVPWTANTVPDWARLVEAGVDGIITDDPAALIAWLRERRLR